MQSTDKAHVEVHKDQQRIMIKAVRIIGVFIFMAGLAVFMNMGGMAAFLQLDGTLIRYFGVALMIVGIGDIVFVPRILETTIQFKDKKKR